MARSGSFNTNSVGWTYVTFNWSIASQDVANNRTTINWNVALHQEAGLSISADYFYLDIDGSRVFSISNRTVAVGQFGSGQLTLNHNIDGTRSFSVSMSGHGSVSFIAGEISGSQTFAIDTIARASGISSAGDVTLGNSCNVKWTPASKNYGFKLKFSVGSWSYTTGAIVPNTTAAYTYTGYIIPMEAANQIKNSKTAAMSVTLYTYSDSSCTTQIGSASTGSFTVTVPNSAAPKAKMVLTPVSSLGSTFDSVYVQKMSKVKVDFTGSEGQYGASIASGVVTILGTKYEKNAASTIESNVLGWAGQVEVKLLVTDSRGYSSEISQKITVIPYDHPAIVPYTGGGGIVCARCTSNGTIDPSGTYLKIKAGRKYSKVEDNAAQKNFCFLGYRIAASGSEFPASYSTLIAKTNTSSDMVDVTLNAGLDLTKSYSVEIYAEDDIGQPSTIAFIIPTEEVAFHLKPGGKGAAFGKYAETDELLDIAWDLRARGRVRIGDGDEEIIDFVTERGTAVVGAATWHYCKWHSGRVEMWCRQDIASGAFNGSGNLYYSNVLSVTLPFKTDSGATSASVSVHSSGITWAATAGAWGDIVSFSVGRMYGGTESLALTVQIYVCGLLA